MLKAIVVTAAMVIASPALTQVRVITGDVVHYYGPNGQLLDDPALQEKNARIEEERMRIRRIQRQRAEYEERMRAINENYDRAIADIEQRRENIQESAERAARGQGWNLH
jgi:hypothetical protein